MRLDAKGETALEYLRPQQVSEGWNLGVIETRDRTDFSDARTMEGVTFASPLQTYLDLLQASGRARDVAQHLRHAKLDA